MKFLPLALLAILCSCERAQSPPGEIKYPDTSQLDPITMENHTAVMVETFGMPRQEIRSVGILVYDGVNDLDVMGPRYVLGTIMGAKIQLISVTDTNMLTSVKQLRFAPDTHMGAVDSLDILVIPGGFEGTIAATHDKRVHEWIRKIDRTSKYTTSVCTGGHILAASGLLEGKKATTNWYRAEEMLDRYGAEFVNARWTRDGKYWTSAGVTAGMDMSLALLAEIHGEKYAQAIMLDMEYDPEPPFTGGSPESTPLKVFHIIQSMYDYGFKGTEQSETAVPPVKCTRP